MVAISISEGHKTPLASSALHLSTPEAATSQAPRPQVSEVARVAGLVGPSPPPDTAQPTRSEEPGPPAPRADPGRSQQASGGLSRAQLPAASTRARAADAPTRPALTCPPPPQRGSQVWVGLARQSAVAPLRTRDRQTQAPRGMLGVVVPSDRTDPAPTSRPGFSLVIPLA